MPDYNVFQDQGLFSVQHMTAAVNRIPYAPRLIQSMNLFANVPTNTRTPIIERRFGERQILPGVPFGVRNNVYDVPDRFARPLNTWSANVQSHVSKKDTVGVRRFGTMEVESVAGVLADRLEWMRQDSVESTIEAWRMQALFGLVANPDGTILANWYNFFEVSPTQKDFSVAAMTTPTSVMQYCKGIKDTINDVLQGIPSTGFVGILGDNAWAKLFSVPEIQEAFKYRSIGDQTHSVAFTTETLGTPHPNQTSINWGALANVFTFAGITFLNYRSSVDFPTDKAVFFPMGVRDMFQSVLSPSSLIEEDGEMGMPFYAKTWPKEDGSGMGIYVESNRIEVNALPEACIQATFS